MELKTAAVKALIVLAPSYAVAFATEKMVYVIPTLAAAGFFAAAADFGMTAKTRNRRVEEDDAQNQKKSDQASSHPHSSASSASNAKSKPYGAHSNV